MSTHEPVIISSTSQGPAGEDRIYFRARCTCRWQHWHLPDTQEQAEVEYAEHLAEIASIPVPPLTPGDRVQFDGKRTSWLVRGTAMDGRYAVLTGSLFGEVYYTIADRLHEVRGPLNVIGGGVGIETTSGPDVGVDDTIRRLEGRPSRFDVEHHGKDPDGWDGGLWEVSQRNRVPLIITKHTPAAGRS